MSQRKIKGIKNDIVFELKSVTGDMIEYSLTPLTQKDAANVFHNVLVDAFGAISNAVNGVDDGDKIKSVIESIKNNISFDDLWFLLSKLLKHAVVDDNEVVDLDNSKIFDIDPHHMYLVLYHGIKGNWPGVFFVLQDKMGGMFSKMKGAAEQMTVDRNTV